MKKEIIDSFKGGVSGAEIMINEIQDIFLMPVSFLLGFAASTSDMEAATKLLDANVGRSKTMIEQHQLVADSLQPVATELQCTMTASRPDKKVNIPEHNSPARTETTEPHASPAAKEVAKADSSSTQGTQETGIAKKSKKKKKKKVRRL